MTQNHQWLGSTLHPHPHWPEGTQFIQLKSFWSAPLPLQVWYSDGAPSLQHSSPPPWQHLSQLHHPLPSYSYPAKQTPLSSLTRILVHFTLPETKQWKTRAPCLWQKMMTTDVCVDPQSSGHIYPNEHLYITCTSLHRASSVLNWTRSPTRWPNAAHVHLLYNIWGNFGSDLLIMLAFFMFSFNVSLDFLRIWLLFPSPQVSKPPNLPCWTLSPFSLVLWCTTFGTFLFLFTHRSQTVTFELRADSVNHVQLAFMSLLPYEYWLHQIPLVIILILTTTASSKHLLWWWKVINFLCCSRARTKLPSHWTVYRTKTSWMIEILKIGEQHRSISQHWGP